MMQHRDKTHDSVATSNKPPARGQRVPQDATLRKQLIKLAQQRVQAFNLSAPVQIDELRHHAEVLCKENSVNPDLTDFVMLLINNSIWMDTVAAIPYERRILLLPHCLRDSQDCPAQMDEMGLLCCQCGRCVLGMLHEKAEKLGYVLLVAEGTTVVTQLLEQGKVDAVIGVSCLSVLKKAFPHLAARAIPGVAVPLIKDGCVDTEVDLEWLLSVIEMSTANSGAVPHTLEASCATVHEWFTAGSIETLLGKPTTSAGKLSQAWLAGDGKRWRPFLTLCAYQVLSKEPSDNIRKIAVAVECFHKASLIHDDIEDEDDLRNGRHTLHHDYGVGVALNAGDLLLGEGYRLIAESGFAADLVHKLLTSASRAHRELCHGQGEELMWTRSPAVVDIPYVLNIFKLKTGPAFEVALSMGAICAGADDTELDVLKKFSEALGICYQIRDDLEDLQEKRVFPLAPSILFAIACENHPCQMNTLLADLETSGKNTDPWLKIFEQSDAEKRARQLLRYYRHEASRSLERLADSELQNLLRRTIVWILGE